MTTSLCLIHGWGANGHIFDHFRQYLPSDWHITAPHLHGHGNAPEHAPFSITQMADELAVNLYQPTVVFGWSLGGLVALHLAMRYPEQVRGLILCASFARLQSAPDYPEGIHADTLRRMAGLFQQDYPQHMRQFLELQLLHTPDRAQILHAVLPDMIRYGTPSALYSALDAVEQADVRAQLPDIHTPTLLLYGSHDRITPLPMGEYLAKHLPHAQLHIIRQSAHAPFLSHAQECGQVVQNWISRL